MSTTVARKEIQEVLLEVGIPASLLGFAYIVYAEQLLLRENTYARNMTKGLYVTIAKEFNTTAASVERCIRHAINVAWASNGKNYTDMLFKNSINPKKVTPTNSQFISRIYFYLANENKETETETVA